MITYIFIYMFAKCVLRSPVRGGKSKKARWRCNQHTGELLIRWQNGDYCALWKEGAPEVAVKSNVVSPDSPGQSISPAQRRNIISALSDGRIGAAATILNSSGMAPDTPDTLVALKSKHPVGPSLVAPDDLPSATHITPDVVFRKLNPIGSCAGPSGLSPLHIMSIITPDSQACSLRRFADCVNLLASGNVCSDADGLIMGASLHALAKNDGGVRPLAAGDVWRRLVAKCLLEGEDERLAKMFSPFQLGVCVKGGFETLIHALRRIALNPGNSVLLQIDFINAFNSVSREVFLKKVVSILPGAAKWSWKCYGEHSKLVYRNTCFRQLLVPNRVTHWGLFYFALSFMS